MILVPSRAQWFEQVRKSWTTLNSCQVSPQAWFPVLTTLNLLEPLWCRGKHAYRAGSSEFGVVAWNHCDTGWSRPTGQFWVSLGWFDNTEPPRTTLLRTHVKFHHRPGFLCWTIVRTGTVMQGKQAYRAVLSEFGVVWPLWTPLNHCDAGGSRPTEQVRENSGWFDHTKPPWTIVSYGTTLNRCEIILL